MRIALFTEVFLPKIDGVVNTLCHLLNHLDQSGHSSLVIAPQGSQTRYTRTPILSTPAASLPFYPELRIANPLINLEKEIDLFKPDLVHVLNPVVLGLSGVRYARSRGLPLVASYHTDLAGFAARWGLGFLGEGVWSYLRAIHNLADLNLCPSNAVRQELAVRGFQHLQVWSRGVDTQLFHPGQANPEWRDRLSAGNPNQPLLLYAGRLSAEKRIDWIQEALRKYPQTRLAIVGDGPQRAYLEKAFEGLPVVFTGYLRGKDLAQAYASSDIFVFPAANETFGNVILEAMASGLPVIAPRSGGPLDFVRHESTGLLFEPEDNTQISASLKILLDRPELSAQMGKAGRADAEKRRWEDVLDGLTQVYARLISTHPKLYPYRQSRDYKFFGLQR